jgi:ketosteroid isomerase-like protein
MTRSTKLYLKSPYLNWSFPFLLSFILIVGMSNASHAQDTRDTPQNLLDRVSPSESPEPSIDTPQNLPSQVNPFESPTNTDISQNAPQELKDIIAEIDAAANQKDATALMQFYSPEFTNSDGLTSLTMPQALSKTWSRYPQLTYQTQIVSWEKKGDELIAETVTNIRGQQQTKQDWLTSILKLKHVNLLKTKNYSNKKLSQKKQR